MYKDYISAIGMADLIVLLKLRRLPRGPLLIFGLKMENARVRVIIV